MNKVYDCIIIGGGIAGLTAAIYAKRGGLKTLIIEKNQLGGQIINASDVTNYPGIKSINGFDLINNVIEQVKSLDVEIIFDEVIKINKDNIETKSEIIDYKTLIIATGLDKRKLGIENEYIGKGVSYCATCDGNFFKEKDVAVIGGGNTALEDALYLSNIAKKVYIILRRDVFRGEEFLVKKIINKDNIEIVYNETIEKLSGDVLESITLSSGRIINCSGLFIAIGNIANSNLFKDILKINEEGFIISNDCLTNIENIFVAGDVRESSLKQLITASSDGAIAANHAIEFLNIK